MKWSKDGNFSIRKNHNHMDELRDYTKENQNSIYEIGQNVEPSHSVSSGQSLAVPAQRVHPWRGGPWQSVDVEHFFNSVRKIKQILRSKSWLLLRSKLWPILRSKSWPIFWSKSRNLTWSSISVVDVFRSILYSRMFGYLTVYRKVQTLWERYTVTKWQYSDANDYVTQSVMIWFV